MRLKHWILLVGTFLVCSGAILWVVLAGGGVREIVEERVAAPEPLSLEGYRAEFRYLRDVFRKIDLEGPPVLTDGWTFNIPEAEWPFMSFCYFGYACCNLARCDPEIRDEALSEVRYVIEALQTPRLAGFITPHFGQPFGKKDLTPSVFVHGHFLNAAMRYREVSGDRKYDELIHQVAAALIESFGESDQGVLPSYEDMWWLTDNFVAMSALARYARAFSKDISGLKDRLVKSVRSRYLDDSTGLGFGAVREFPRGARGSGDVDSGPVFEGDRLRYQTMPPVGQAVILFGKTLRMPPLQ